MKNLFSLVLLFSSVLTTVQSEEVEDKELNKASPLYNLLFVLDNSGSMDQQHLRLLDILEEIHFQFSEADPEYQSSQLSFGLIGFSSHSKAYRFNGKLWGSYEDCLLQLTRITQGDGREDGLLAIQEHIKRYVESDSFNKSAPTHIFLLSDEPRDTLHELNIGKLLSLLQSFKTKVHYIALAPERRRRRYADASSQGFKWVNTFEESRWELKKDRDYFYFDDKFYYELAKATKGSVWITKSLDLEPFGSALAKALVEDQL